MALRRICELKIDQDGVEEVLVGSFSSDIKATVKPTVNSKPSHELLFVQGEDCVRVTGMFQEKPNDQNIILSGNVRPNCFYKVVQEGGRFFLMEDFPMPSNGTATMSSGAPVKVGFFSSMKASIAGRELNKARLQKSKKR